MQIRVNLVPQRVEGQTIFGTWRNRESILRVISQNHSLVHSYSQFYVGLTELHSSGFVRVYSIEKRRKKVEVLKKPVKWTRKELRVAGLDPLTEKWHKRKLVHPTHWVGVYYDIPVSLLQQARLRVVQGQRTFCFEQL